MESLVAAARSKLLLSVMAHHDICVIREKQSAVWLQTEFRLCQGQLYISAIHHPQSEGGGVWGQACWSWPSSVLWLLPLGTTKHDSHSQMDYDDFLIALIFSPKKIIMTLSQLDWGLGSNEFSFPSSPAFLSLNWQLPLLHSPDNLLQGFPPLPSISNSIHHLFIFSSLM